MKQARTNPQYDSIYVKQADPQRQSRFVAVKGCGEREWGVPVGFPFGAMKRFWN